MIAFRSLVESEMGTSIQPKIEKARGPVDSRPTDTQRTGHLRARLNSGSYPPAFHSSCLLSAPAPFGHLLISLSGPLFGVHVVVGHVKSRGRCPCSYWLGRFWLRRSPLYSRTSFSNFARQFENCTPPRFPRYARAHRST